MQLEKHIWVDIDYSAACSYLAELFYDDLFIRGLQNISFQFNTINDFLLLTSVHKASEIREPQGIL